jgi:hypothetical protein
MNLETYYDYLSKKSDGTFSFDEDALVFSGGKMHPYNAVQPNYEYKARGICRL